ncbi:MAG: PadR family transcriptional regulator [Erysipelotrichaceae bacterium]
MNEIVDGLIVELRRGTVSLAVLRLLDEKAYGYALVASLQAGGFIVDPSTLYPLLRRLEKQGLLESHWDTEGAKPRKYYIRSTLGSEVLVELMHEWQSIRTCVDRLL